MSLPPPYADLERRLASRLAETLNTYRRSIAERLEGESRRLVAAVADLHPSSLGTLLQEADLALELGAQWNDVTSIALRNDRFLKLRSRLDEIALQTSHEPIVGDLQPAPNIGQANGGRIQHLTAFGEDTADRIHDPERIRQAERRARKLRSMIGCILE